MKVFFLMLLLSEEVLDASNVRKYLVRKSVHVVEFHTVEYDNHFLKTIVNGLELVGLEQLGLLLV